MRISCSGSRRRTAGDGIWQEGSAAAAAGGTPGRGAAGAALYQVRRAFTFMPTFLLSPEGH